MKKRMRRTKMILADDMKTQKEIKDERYVALINKYWDAVNKSKDNQSLVSAVVRLIEMSQDISNRKEGISDADSERILKRIEEIIESIK